MVAGMSGDIVVQLADGVYRLSAPLRLTAADSGTNGHTVSWQAAPSAHPVISGARQVTGWIAGRLGEEHLAGQRRRRDRHPAALRQRRRRPPGPAPREPLRLHRHQHRTAVHQQRPELPEQPGQPEPGRGRERSTRSPTGTRRCRASAATSSRCSSRPGTTTLRVRHVRQPVPGRVRCTSRTRTSSSTRPVSGTSTPATGILYYIPPSGQNMSTVDVELPMLQSLVDVGGTLRRARAPHLLLRHHLHRHQLARAQQQPGLRRPADRRVHLRQLVVAGLRLLCHPAARSSRPPGRTGTRCPPRCRCPRPTPSPSAATSSSTSARPPSASATTPTPTPAGVGLGASSITVTGSEFASDAAGAIVAGGVRADAHHPSDSADDQPRHHHQQQLVHDIGLDYRGIVSFLPTYVTNATITPQRGLQHAVLRPDRSATAGAPTTPAAATSTPTAACTTTSRATPPPPPRPTTRSPATTSTT